MILLLLTIPLAFIPLSQVSRPLVCVNLPCPYAHASESTLHCPLFYVAFPFLFAEASKVITSAKIEAMGAPYGIGVVKLMGRFAGFISAHATMATGGKSTFDIKRYFSHGSLSTTSNHVLVHYLRRCGPLLVARISLHDWWRQVHVPPY